MLCLEPFVLRVKPVDEKTLLRHHVLRLTKRESYESREAKHVIYVSVRPIFLLIREGSLEARIVMQYWRI